MRWLDPSVYGRKRLSWNVSSHNIDAHLAFTMYLVREHGRWTAADNVHLVN